MCEVAKIKTEKLKGFIDVSALTKDRQLIGQASLSKHKTDKSFLWVHQLEVHPLCRKQGIGSIMMDHIADLAKKESVDLVYVYPAPLEDQQGKPSTHKQLQKFYRKQGFKPCNAPQDAVTVTDEGLLKRGMCLVIKHE